MTTHGAFFNIFFFDIRGVVHYESFWYKNNITTINHPPYSPDLPSPCDFYLLPTLLKIFLIFIRIGTFFRNTQKYSDSLYLLSEFLIQVTSEIF
ncbi:hypothetical protein ALC56_12946 [Trachymyrmex septentrionalis]|uniref:Histone-lysine N-methyltransferase SETMAR n=1 Tax=Trachymyrmex septentrionalis TaxID=34720 RepID=A0A195EXP4_9HYME|nr:hypothetical protein ALC56_12946 [Trachymyrmex septentrionalis]